MTDENTPVNVADLKAFEAAVGEAATLGPMNPDEWAAAAYVVLAKSLRIPGVSQSQIDTTTLLLGRVPIPTALAALTMSMKLQKMAQDKKENNDV